VVLKLLLPLLLCLTICCSETPQQAEIINDLPTPELQFDLNLVTLEQLQTIPNLGKNVEAELIALQQQMQFKRVEDLLAVRGIGEKTFLRIRGYFYISTDE
jgi:hypothetical protein